MMTLYMDLGDGSMNFNGNRFPDWQTLYLEQEASTLPWYYKDLDPDLTAILKALRITGRLSIFEPLQQGKPRWPIDPYRFDRDDIHSIFEPAFQVVSIADTIYQGTLEEKPIALFALLQRDLYHGYDD
jgi:hypothetical protein